ncbi:MAG: acyltransferase family protein [Gammaproteobacteria bacterium]|jgi:glucans biosynthesis protein C|nr:acyltransferase family protein [Gammaproteobacteria bacterium]MBT6043536.1 acyltransferase family protein [Gammaproteobacteria bacterium]
MQQTRLHALDAIRGIALLLGLLLHGSMSFWPGLDSFGYPFSDNSKSMTLTYMFYVLHMFRMAIFFLIAGFFAHLSLARKGPREFVKDRLKRIALPMVLAFIISLLLIVPIALWAASKFYGPDYLSLLLSYQQSTPAQPLLMHFWFLYYLLWFYALAVLGSIILGKLNPADTLMNKVTELIYFLCKFRFIAILATGISAWVFYTRADWYFWAGIPTPTEAVWNESPAFIIYGMAFFIGWAFDRQRDCFVVLKSHWPQYLLLALVMTGFSISRLNPVPFVLLDISNTDKLIFAISYALASWCWIFALTGAGIHYFDKENALRRYLADASYWIYIAHIPLLLFLQTLLMDIPWHWSIKFPLIILISSTLLLWTYDRWVRYTIIGTILNGSRQRKNEQAQGQSSEN